MSAIRPACSIVDLRARGGVPPGPIFYYGGLYGEIRTRTKYMSLSQNSILVTANFVLRAWVNYRASADM